MPIETTPVALFVTVMLTPGIRAFAASASSHEAAYARMLHRMEEEVQRDTDRCGVYWLVVDSSFVR
jgi:hypothetical protein